MLVSFCLLLISCPTSLSLKFPETDLMRVLATPHFSSGGCRLFSSRHLHDFVRKASCSYQARHDFHRPIDVGEELLITRAKIVQSVLTIGCFDESIFGALAVTSKAHRALSAVTRQGVFLVLAKLNLLRRGK